MPSGVVHRILERVAVVGGAENGPAQPQDAGDVPGRERPRPGRIEQAVKAVFEADDLDAGIEGRLDDGADDGVEAGCITAAGEHANTFDGRHDSVTIF